MSTATQRRSSLSRLYETNPLAFFRTGSYLSVDPPLPKKLKGGRTTIALERKQDMRTIPSPAANRTDASLDFGWSQSEDDLLLAGSSFGCLSEVTDVTTMAAPGGKSLGKQENIVSQLRQLAEKHPELAERIVHLSERRNEEASVRDGEDARESIIASSSNGNSSDTDSLIDFIVENVEAGQTASKIQELCDQLEEKISKSSSLTTSSSSKVSNSSRSEEKGASELAQLEKKASTSPNSSRMEKKASSSSSSIELKASNSSNRSRRSRRKSSAPPKTLQTESKLSTSSFLALLQRKTSSSSRSTQLLQKASTDSQPEVMSSFSLDLQEDEVSASSTFCSQVERKDSLKSQGSSIRSARSKKSVTFAESITQNSQSDDAIDSNSKTSSASLSHEKSDTLEGPPRSITAGRSPIAAKASPSAHASPSTPVNPSPGPPMDSSPSSPVEPSPLPSDRTETEETIEKVDSGTSPSKSESADPLDNTDETMCDESSEECDTSTGEYDTSTGEYESVDSVSTEGGNATPRATSPENDDALDANEVTHGRASPVAAEWTESEQDKADGAAMMAATKGPEEKIVAGANFDPSAETAVQSPGSKVAKRYKLKEFLRSHSSKKPIQERVDESDALYLEPGHLQHLTQKALSKLPARFETNPKESFDQPLSRGDSQVKSDEVQKLGSVSTMLPQNTPDTPGSKSGPLKSILKNGKFSKLNSPSPEVHAPGLETLLQMNPGETGTLQKSAEETTKGISVETGMSSEIASDSDSQGGVKKQDKEWPVAHASPDNYGWGNDDLASEVVTEELNDMPIESCSATNGSINHSPEGSQVQADKISNGVVLDGDGKRASLFARLARAASPMKFCFGSPKVGFGRQIPSPLASANDHSSSIKNTHHDEVVRGAAKEEKNSEGTQEERTDSSDVASEDSTSLHGLVQETEVIDGENETEVVVSYKATPSIRAERNARHESNNQDNIGPLSVCRVQGAEALASIGADLAISADVTGSEEARSDQAARSTPAHEGDGIKQGVGGNGNCDPYEVVSLGTQNDDASTKPRVSPIRRLRSVLSRVSAAFSPIGTGPSFSEVKLCLGSKRDTSSQEGERTINPTNGSAGRI